jgi:hypothetical protein
MLAYPNILCPGQAQVLHKLPTGEALPGQRLHQSADGRIAAGYFLTTPEAPSAALLKAGDADRTS